MYLPATDRQPALTLKLALRVAIIGAVALAAFSIIFFRLWFLQVLSGDRYLTEARNNQVRELRVEAADVVITTALVPGKAAPVLVKAETVERMKPGSVIVDLAAEAGGNCELTEAGQEVIKHGVTMVGPLNLPSTMPTHASQLYSRNVSALLLNMISEGALNLDFEDEITAGTCITHEGKIVNEAVQAASGVAAGAA